MNPDSAIVEYSADGLLLIAALVALYLVSDMVGVAIRKRHTKGGR